LVSKNVIDQLKEIEIQKQKEQEKQEYLKQHSALFSESPIRQLEDTLQTSHYDKNLTNYLE